MIHRVIIYMSTSILPVCKFLKCYVYYIYIRYARKYQTNTQIFGTTGKRSSVKMPAGCQRGMLDHLFILDSYGWRLAMCVRPVFMRMDLLIYARRLFVHHERDNVTNNNGLLKVLRRMIYRECLHIIIVLIILSIKACRKCITRTKRKCHDL